MKSSSLIFPEFLPPLSLSISPPSTPGTRFFCIALAALELTLQTKLASNQRTSASQGLGLKDCAPPPAGILHIFLKTNQKLERSEPIRKKGKIGQEMTRTQGNRSSLQQ